MVGGRPRLVAILALGALCLVSSGCGEGEAGRYARLEGAPPPPEVFGSYRGDGGRLVVRPPSDPACEEVLGAVMACYTHDEGLGPTEANSTDPIDAGPVAVLGGEIALQAAYTVDPPEESCAGLRGHHELVRAADGLELRLVRFFFRDRPVTVPTEGPCVPPEVWERVR